MQQPDCLFCKISSGQLGTEMLYEDADLVAFKDVDPQAPVHILIVPKAHIPDASALNMQHGQLLGKVFSVAAQLCAQQGLTNGYRIVTNIGADGGQSVPHLHFHVLGGRAMAWPPG